MDTRPKILTPAAVLSLANVTAYVAHFDPLHPAQVRRLSGLISPGETLLAVVLNPEAPLLPLEARAELAAALAIIDFVVPIEIDPAAFLSQLAPARIVHDETEDALRTERLIEHVRNRYR